MDELQALRTLLAGIAEALENPVLSVEARNELERVQAEARDLEEQVARQSRND